MSASDSPEQSTALPAAVAEAKQLLEGLLSACQLEAQVRPEATGRDLVLQILSEKDAAILSKNRGRRIEDLQYLVNRILLQKDKSAPKILVDFEHQKEQSEAEFLKKVKAEIDQVAKTGQPHQLEPLNSYYRRLVHNLIALDDRVSSWSPRSSERLKQITIMPAKH